MRVLENGIELTVPDDWYDVMAGNASDERADQVFDDCEHFRLFNNLTILMQERGAGQWSVEVGEESTEVTFSDDPEGIKSTTWLVDRDTWLTLVELTGWNEPEEMFVD